MIALFRILLRDSVARSSWAVWTLGALAVGFAIVTVLPVTRSLESATLSSPYFDIAVNRAWCGRYPYVTGMVPANRARVDFVVVDPGEFPGKPIRDIAVAALGSVDAYCAMQGGSFAMNEISFALIESAFLRGVPDITFFELGRYLAWLRVALIGLFGVLLVRLHYSPLFVFSAVGAALYLTVLLGHNALYSQYPFVLPALLLGVAAGGLCLLFKLHHRGVSFVMAAFGLGLWAAWLGNLRTSQYPGALVVGAVFLLLAALDRRRRSGEVRRGELWVVAAAACWIAGVAVFDLAYVRPVRAAVAGHNSSAHGIAHPLVLGLANPPNDLSRREGIEWSDPTGFELARRVDADVSYLGVGYEQALFSYYLQLWARHPSEMAQIYVMKVTQASRIVLNFLASTAPNIFWSQKDGFWLAITVLPLSLLVGLVPVPLFFAAMILAGWRLRRDDPSRAFLLSSMGLVGLLSFGESSIILGGVVLWYSSVFVYCTVFSGLLTYQAGLDLLATPFKYGLRLLRHRLRPVLAPVGSE